MRQKVLDLVAKGKLLFLVNIASSALNFINVFALARLLSAELYGFIPLARSYQVLVESALEFGMGPSVQKRLSQGKDNEKTIRTSFALRSLTSIIGFIALAALGYFSPPPLSYAIFAFALYYAFSNILMNIMTFYYARLNQNAIAILAFARDAFRLVFSVAFVILGFGVAGAAFGWLAGVLVALAIGLYLAKNDNLLSFGLDRQEAKEVLKSGFFLNATSLGSYVFPALVTILAGALLAISEVSIISVSLSFAAVFYLFLSPLTSFIYPFMCQNINEPKFKVFLQFLMRYWAALVILGLAGIMVGGNFIFGLLGKGFLEGSTVFWVIAAAIFLDSFKAISDPLLAARGKEKAIMKFELVKFVAFAVALAVLAQMYQISALIIAFAILLSFASSFIFRFASAYDYAALSWKEVSAILLAFILLIPLGLFPLDRVQKIAAVLLYGVLIFLLGIVRIGDAQNIMDAIRAKAVPEKAPLPKVNGAAA